MVEPAERVHPGASVLLSAHPEGEQVDVMAALGDQAEAALGLIAPISPG